MTDTFTWLAFVAVQGIVLVAAIVLVRRRGQPGAKWHAPVLIGAGSIVVLANLAWVITGGPAGESFIGMRGGILGFWLSLVTASEILALGLLSALLRGR
ncbi:MAG TPA: hypothetical protein VF071_08725 [Candidatus Limnocylindria bacterium]